MRICDLHSGDRGLNVTSGPQEAYLLGWWQATTRQAKAVVTLADADHGFECAPLLRSMTEHYAAIATLVREPGFWRALERNRIRRASAVQEWLRERDGDEWAELDAYRELLARETDTDANTTIDNLTKARHQIEQLGSKAVGTYVRYQYFTHHSHATSETAMPFVSPPDRECHTCLTDALPLDSPVAEGQAALILLDTATIYNGLLGGVWSDELDHLGTMCEPLRRTFG